MQRSKDNSDFLTSAPANNLIVDLCDDCDGSEEVWSVLNRERPVIITSKKDLEAFRQNIRLDTKVVLADYSNNGTVTFEDIYTFKGASPKTFTPIGDWSLDAGFVSGRQRNFWLDRRNLSQYRVEVRYELNRVVSYSGTHPIFRLLV